MIGHRLLRGVIRAGSIVLFVAIPAGEAGAGDPAQCTQYAQKAVEQGQQAVAAGCNFSGPRWQASYQQHYDWCLAVPPEAANFETQARETELAKCTQGGETMAPLQPGTLQPAQPLPPGELQTTKQACADYAKAAVAQVAENVKLGCGFSGGRWSSDYQTHYNWCLGAGAQAAAESKARQAELAACQRQKTCTAYAQTAVAQQAKNLSEKCGLSGPAWNSSFDYHYKWCLAGGNVTQTAGQTKARDNQLAQCGQNKPLDGSFKIKWVAPKISPSGIVDRIDINIEFTGANVWTIGDYGHPKYGSLWAEVTALSYVWENGLVKAKKSKPYIFSVRGMAGGTQAFLNQVIPAKVPAGTHNMTLQVKPAYPNMQLAGVREKFKVPSEPFGPGRAGCWFSYPKIDVAVFIVTTGNVVTSQSATTGDIQDAPLTTVDVGEKSDVIYYDCN